MLSFGQMRGPIPDKPANRPTVPEVRALVEHFYQQPGNGCGGLLHCALDDGNLEDEFLALDIARAKAEGDRDAEQIATMLFAMTRTQRRKVYRTANR